MALGQGLLIEDEDYTLIYNKIADVYGRNDNGYGQIMAANPVGPGVKLQLQEWQDLRTYILNSRIHQIGTSATLFTIAVGDRVEYNAHIKALNDMADAAVTNKRAIHSTQYSTPAESSTSSTITSWGGTGSTGKLTLTLTASGMNTHGDGTERGLKYFFNSGGTLKLRFSLTNIPISGVSASKSSNWQTLMSNIGTIEINHNSVVGSGNSITPPGGFYGVTLGGAAVEIFRRNAAGLSTYTENYFNITMQRQSGYIDFKCTWYDVDSGDQRSGYLPGPAQDEPVGGNMVAFYTQNQASGSYVAVNPVVWSVSSTWSV